MKITETTPTNTLSDEAGTGLGQEAKAVSEAKAAAAAAAAAGMGDTQNNVTNKSELAAIKSRLGRHK